MATKSILKNIYITKRTENLKFLSALENAEGKSSKKTVMSRSVRNVKQDEIKNLFGDK
ncbi:MAG: hypothetical protein KBF19_03250 [Negativicutes bacterium]|nr:hypothetical protein [Negativicutes bacterium]